MKINLSPFHAFTPRLFLFARALQVKDAGCNEDRQYEQAEGVGNDAEDKCRQAGEQQPQQGEQNRVF